MSTWDYVKKCNVRLSSVMSWVANDTTNKNVFLLQVVRSDEVHGRTVQIFCILDDRQVYPKDRECVRTGFWDHKFPACFLACSNQILQMWDLPAVSWIDHRNRFSIFDNRHCYKETKGIPVDQNKQHDHQKGETTTRTPSPPVGRVTRP